MSEFDKLKYTTGINFASMIIPTGSQPLDGRTVLDCETLPTNASDFIEGAVYVGMIVSNIHDNKVYLLTNVDATTKDLTWKNVGDLTTVETDITKVETDIAKIEKVTAAALNDLNSRINDMDYTHAAAPDTLITGFTQEDGKITNVTTQSLESGTVTVTLIPVITSTEEGATNELVGAEFSYASGKITNVTSSLTDTSIVLADKRYVDSVATNVKNELLGSDDLNETLDTLKEISYWLDNNPEDSVNLTVSLAELTKKVEENEEVTAAALNDLNNRITDISGGYVTKEELAIALNWDTTD